MMNISFGQYYPGNSVLHRADPRAKLIMAMLYIVCSFLCKGLLSFVLLLLSAFALVLISGIPVGTVLRGIRPVLFVLAFTMILNVFWTSGEKLLLEWWIFKIYEEGIYNAVFMLVRIFALIVGSGIFLTYTTTPIALSGAIESLLSPLKKLHVPVHEFAMMMTIALRFIPTLVEETDKIISAQKARGADFTTGSLAKRAKALVPILIPLFVSAFRRADELATAMECRCYHGGEGRTKMTVTKMRVSDAVAISLMILFGASIVLINIFATKYGIGYSM